MNALLEPLAFREARRLERMKERGMAQFFRSRVTAMRLARAAALRATARMTGDEG